MLAAKNLSTTSFPVIPRAFGTLRKGLGKAFQVSRAQVHPKGKILPLLGGDQTRLSVAWPRLQAALGLELPPLERDWRRCKARKLPRSGRTVGGLTRSLASLNLPELLGPSDPRSQVWIQLRWVVTSCLSVGRADVLLHHHFIHDLNCG